MKRLLITSFVLLALGCVVPAPRAHADLVANGSACTTDDGASGRMQNGQCVPEVSYQSQSVDPAAAKTTTNTTTPDPSKGFGSVMTFIMSLFAWLVGVAAMALDYAVYFTVVKMGSYISNISAVGVTWRIFRDIGNIMFIFGFLASGVAIILGWEGYGFKKALPMLLVGAVFLNFSLFISEAVIDVGNLFATQFFQQINGGSPIDEQFLSSLKFDGRLVQEGISNKIMSQLGLVTLYSRATDTNFGGFDPFMTGIIGFLGIILFLITAFVMFSLAFILVARFVVLVFLIIVAPVGFAGLAMPRLKSLADRWWSALFDQTITAPVLLLLLYVALAVITDVNFLTGICSNANGSTCQNDWLGFLSTKNLQGFASVTLSFLIAMGLLIAVVIASRKLGAFGGSWATKMAGAASFGATAWAARGVIGTGLGGGTSRLLARAAVSKNAGVRVGARIVSFGGKRLQNRTYDLRNIPGAGALAGTLGVAPGTASQLTAKQLQEKRYGWKPTKEWFRSASMEYEKDAAKLDKAKNLATPGTPAFEGMLKKMSADELSELKGIRKGLEDFVKVISPAQYAELQKSDKLLGTEKAALKKTWEAQFEGNAAAGTISRLKTKDIASLDGSILKKPEVINALGVAELDKIRSEGSLDKPDRQAIYDYLASQANNIGTPASVLYSAYFSGPGVDPGGNRVKYWNVNNVPGPAVP